MRFWRRRRRKAHHQNAKNALRALGPDNPIQDYEAARDLYRSITVDMAELMDKVDRREATDDDQADLAVWLVVNEQIEAVTYGTGKQDQAAFIEVMNRCALALQRV